MRIAKPMSSDAQESASALFVLGWWSFDCFGLLHSWLVRMHSVDCPNYQNDGAAGFLTITMIVPRDPFYRSCPFIRLARFSACA